MLGIYCCAVYEKLQLFVVGGNKIVDVTRWPHVTNYRGEFLDVVHH